MTIASSEKEPSPPDEGGGPAIRPGHVLLAGLDLELLEEIAAYFRGVRKKYAKFEGALRGVDSRILIAQVPGGMLTNLENQLREQGASDKLDEVLEVEFTFIHTEAVSAELAAMPRDHQAFVLDWTRRAAAINTELAFQFASRAKTALSEVNADVVSNWCLHAMDSYDRQGLQAAMAVIRDLEGFVAVGHQRAAGSLFEEAVPILLPGALLLRV